MMTRIIKKKKKKKTIHRPMASYFSPPPSLSFPISLSCQNVSVVLAELVHTDIHTSLNSCCPLIVTHFLEIVWRILNVLWWKWKITPFKSVLEFEYFHKADLDDYPMNNEDKQRLKFCVA